MDTEDKNANTDAPSSPERAPSSTRERWVLEFDPSLAVRLPETQASPAFMPSTTHVAAAATHRP